MLKVVFLDVDNTLLDFPACARYAMTEAAAELELCLPEETFSAFLKYNRLLWDQVERGELTASRLFETRWQKIFDEVGVSSDGKAFEQIFLRWLRISAEPVEGAFELLRALHGRFMLCVASNAPYQQQVQRLERAGMLSYMDDLFISEEMGAEKPSGAFFTGCLKRLDKVLPEEILMIGDSWEADMIGAHTAGLRTCWYAPSGKEIPQEGCADYVVRHLNEIPGLLTGTDQKNRRTVSADMIKPTRSAQRAAGMA